MAFPWYLLMMLPDVLKMTGIFGEKKEPSQTQTTTQEGFRGWESPAYGMMEPYMMKLLMENQNMFSGFGMPEGASRNVDMGGMYNDILGLINTEWPQIMKGYAEPTATTPTNPCSQKCEALRQSLVNQKYPADDVRKKVEACRTACVSNA